MPFKDQCLYWHNYFRTLHQVNVLIYSRWDLSHHIRENQIKFCWNLSVWRPRWMGCVVDHPTSLTMSIKKREEEVVWRPLWSIVLPENKTHEKVQVKFIARPFIHNRKQAPLGSFPPGSVDDSSSLPPGSVKCQQNTRLSSNRTPSCGSRS